METESHPLSINWFDSFSNSRVDKAGAFPALDPAQQGNRRLAQAESDQHRFRAGRFTPGSLSRATSHYRLARNSFLASQKSSTAVSKRLISASSSAILAQKSVFGSLVEEVILFISKLYDPLLKNFNIFFKDCKQPTH
jgi:hypothetical protein